MKRRLFKSIALIALMTVPVHAGSIAAVLQPPADALRVEFSSPDTLKAGEPLTVGVVVTRSTGAVQVVPTLTPNWMTYDAQNNQFSGVPIAGHHELSVRATDAGTGQMATGILDFDIRAR